MTTATGAIIVLALFEAKPETQVELRDRLRELERRTRQEAGCIQYELHEDLDDPNRFAFVETWADLAALDAHDHTDHVAAIRRDMPALTAAPADVRRFRKVP